MTDETLAYLRDNDIRFVQVIWCDNANVIRAKMPHVTHIEKTGGVVGIAAAQQALPVMFDGVVTGSGIGPVGEVMLRPDWSTLRALPYLKGFARVLSDMEMNGSTWEHCPRSFLRQQTARLAEHGLTLQASFENEFFLLQETENGVVPVDDTVFAATSALKTAAEVVLAMTEALFEQGLAVETYYPESGPGQHELSIGYRNALDAADAQIAYRDTIRGVAARYGLIASFLPKIVLDKAGSGCHLNMSLWQEGRNTTGDPTTGSRLSRHSEHFIAGILRHLPALCALTVPSNASYRRIRPHFWAGAFTAWGYDNREAGVRVFSGDGTPKRFELKASDATANPYLALGAVLAAGLDGIERELPLPPSAAPTPGCSAKPSGRRC